MEEAIEIITKMMIKEHLEGNNYIYKMKKEDLMKFCIRLLKIVKTNK